MLHQHLAAIHEMSTKLFEYFSEWQDIRESILLEPPSDIVAVDEDEDASDFLDDVGFHKLADDDDDGEKTEDIDYSAVLTPAQIVTLKKRIATFRSKTKDSRKDAQTFFKEKSADPSSPKSTSDADANKSPGTLPFLSIPYNSTSFETSLVLSGLCLLDLESQYLKSKLLTAYKVKNSKTHAELPVFYNDNKLLLFSNKHSTSYEDLSAEDQNMLRTIAEIQLLTLFDSHKIKHTRHKRRKNKKDTDYVFGVSLETLLSRDAKSHENVKAPVFLQELINHLEINCISEEGLLRVPGSSSRIKESKQLIDSEWPSGKFKMDSLMPHDSASILKCFLRELPKPLLTLEWTDAFIQILHLSSSEEKIYAYTLLMLILPSVNRYTLKILLQFLINVSINKHNKMTEDSVAMVAAPNLFMHCESPPGQLNNQEVKLNLAYQHTEVVKLLLKHQKEIQTVPEELIVQVRKMNEQKKKHKIKVNINNHLLKPINHVMLYIKTDFSDEEIPIEIKNITSVSNVIDKCLIWLNNKGLGVDETSSCFNLIELGGNISEIRLDQNTNMMLVHRTNPKAAFLLRSCSQV